MTLSELTRVLNIISEPTRLRILLALSERKMCVCELCAALGLGQAVASQHLRVLRDCGLVLHRKNGLWVDYELSKNALAGPSGRILSSILLEASKNETIRKDRKAAIKVDRKVLCCDSPKQRNPIPHA